jgi:hypothetical protein
VVASYLADGLAERLRLYRFWLDNRRPPVYRAAIPELE